MEMGCVSSDIIIILHYINSKTDQYEITYTSGQPDTVIIWVSVVKYATYYLIEIIIDI